MARAKNPAATIRPMLDGDEDAVLAIYRDGIETGHATFQDGAPGWAAWNAGHHTACRLVADLDGEIAGWAALSAVSARPVYSGVCEVSVYVAATVRGRGVGRILMKSLIAESERNGIWTLQAGIFPENKASIALHEAAGFCIVGTRRKLGKMAHGPQAGQWRDVVLMERRSAITGQH